MTVYNENNVPILFIPDQKVGLSEDGYRELKAARDEARQALYAASDAVRTADPRDEEGVVAAREAQAAAEAKYLLAGHSVVIHNKAPRGGTDEQTKTFIGIGASDIDEAIKESIAAFDLAHLGTPDESSDTEYPPDWVASSHDLLGRLLADYYDCELRNLAEVL